MTIIARVLAAIWMGGLVILAWHTGQTDPDFTEMLVVNVFMYNSLLFLLGWLSRGKI